MILHIYQLMTQIFHQNDEMVYRYENLRLYAESMKLYKDKIEIPITAAEFKLLQTLFRNQGQVLSRDQLISQAYGYEYEGFDRTVDSTIKRLRQKIEDDPKKPRFLQTKYGAGYMLGGNEN